MGINARCFGVSRLLGGFVRFHSDFASEEVQSDQNINELYFLWLTFQRVRIKDVEYGTDSRNFVWWCG
ncbi:hypothetical protein EMIT051CA3_30169 [Pseudomonas chlororaphis]